MTGHIQGIRYSCRDGFKTARPVTMRYKIDRRDMEDWLRLLDGPTGYESMRLFLNDAIQNFMAGKYWLACMGTMGKWDKLIIPASEMLRIIAKSSELFNTQNYKEVPMTETKDVVIDDKSMVPSPEAIKELQENLEGIDPVFPVIKVIHQGQMFEMPDGEMTRSFLGIIVDTNAVNAWWKIGFDESGGGDPPDCSSSDSMRPDSTILEPQDTHCKVCAKNQFGSEVPKEAGEEVFGKACKNMRRVHVLVEGSILPYRLTLSPANLKPANMFLTILASQGLSYLHVITEFSLKEAKNRKGIKYSEIVFKKAKVIENKGVIAQLKKMKEQMMEAMRGQMITPEEYAPDTKKGE